MTRVRSPKISKECLDRWRAVPAKTTLAVLADYCKADLTFEPVSATGTERWHARLGDREYEFLLNGPKYFDTRTRRGGGGAVDLAMFLLDVDFRAAATVLRAASL